MSQRAYNFSPGPATLPQPVLEQIQADALNWRGVGASVMEISHRSSDFMALAEQIEASLRRLLVIPEQYRVLLVQGGATTQFAALPLNLCRHKRRVNYFCTGHWSVKAIQEARRYSDVRVVADTSSSGYTTLPADNDWFVDSDAAYVHFTPNETIQGVEFLSEPDVGELPLVADMSSTLLSCPIDISRYAVIYASAQKNIGPAGVTIVIVREDCLDQAMATCPGILNYCNQVASQSMYNTPVTFVWYAIGLVLSWLEQQGGLLAMAERHTTRSRRLYETIDNSNFYHNAVVPQARSRMNVPFTLLDPRLEPVFLDQAQQRGLLNLKGHRSVGGIRASLYNAMPTAGVEALISYMIDFQSDFC